MGLLQKFKQWLDGWEDQPDKQATSVQAEAQEFAVRLVRELDARLRQEILVLPDGPALVPLGWLIFFSGAEDRAWRGLKRQALQEWLTRILLERTQTLLPAGGVSPRPRLEIRLDPTLRPGDFRILPLWDIPSPTAALGLSEPGRRV
jgi:hypothetical protein